MNSICPECGGDEFHPCEFCRQKPVEDNIFLPVGSSEHNCAWCGKSGHHFSHCPTRHGFVSYNTQAPEDNNQFLRAEIAALKQEIEALRTRLRLSEENARPVTPPGYSKCTTEAEWIAAVRAAGAR